MTQRPQTALLFDIVPPPYAGRPSDARDREGSLPVSDSPKQGPLVCDLFVGQYPQHGAATIQLPSVICLPVRSVDAPDTRRDDRQGRADEIEFLPAPRLPTDRTAIDRDAFLAEFSALLEREEERARAFFQDGRRLQAARRIELRASLEPAVGSSAGSVHVRVRAAGLPRSFRQSREHRRAREAAHPARLPLRKLARGPWEHTPPAARGGRAESPTPAPVSPSIRSAGSVLLWIGAFALSGTVLLLGQMSSLGPVADSVRATANRGARQLVAGFRGLAAADARTGAWNFSAARQSFARATETLSTSTTSLQRLAARLDPAGRLPAAQTLLSVGERAAALGSRSTQVLERFQRSSASLTETLEALTPQLTRIGDELHSLSATVSRIERSGLPESDVGTVRTLSQALRALDQTVEHFLRSESVVLELLGSRMDRQYLVLFQNSRELRPTGGFIGSFALIDVSRGHVRNVRVDTTYNPDGQLKDFLSPPAPLKKIVSRWFARDANWFADFRRSAAKVAHFFERSGGPTVDGVLAVTPYLLEDLLRLTGPIPMPEYEVTVSAENVVSETQRRVTFDYNRERNQPKAFLADLLPEVFNRMIGLSPERRGDLADVLAESLAKKQALVFFRDAEAEDAVVRLGWGGTLPQLPAPTSSSFADHIGRVEANIGGHKTDGLIEQRMDYDVTLGSDGAIVGTVVVTRHHGGPKTGTPGLNPAEDPARKQNVVYERTFVPSGSVLLDARGFVRSGEVPRPAPPDDPLPFALDRDPDLAELEGHDQYHPSGIVASHESGFTTFGGWVITEPEETTVTVLRYQLPFRVPRPSLLASFLRYELFMTHQPGHLPVATRATVRVPEGFRVAWAEPSGRVSQASGQKVAYSAVVDRDALWGVILEEY